MASEWFYRAAGAELGPLTSNQLKALADGGQIAPDDRVRKGCDGKWVAASRVRGLFMPNTTSTLESQFPPVQESKPSPPLDVPTVVTSPIRPTAHTKRARPGVRGIAPLIAANAAVCVVCATVAIVTWMIVNKKQPAQSVVTVAQQPTQPPEVVSAGSATPSSRTTKNSSGESPAKTLTAAEKPVPAEATTAEPIVAPPQPLLATAHVAEHLPDVVQSIEPAIVRLDVTKRSGTGIGSGFLVDDKGTIVTNYHVINGATKAIATFPDRRTFAVVSVLRLLPKSDLAAVRLEAGDKWPRPLVLAAEAPRKGEAVVAIGAPHGLSFTVSEGVVSAVRTGPEMGVVMAALDASFPFDQSSAWIQTSAPISPGNSGGPLLNITGEVVGVNSWFLADSQNLNFAVSSKDVRRLLAGDDDAVTTLSDIAWQTHATRDELAQSDIAIRDIQGSDDAAKKLRLINAVHVIAVSDAGDGFGFKRFEGGALLSRGISHLSKSGITVTADMLKADAVVWIALSASTSGVTSQWVVSAELLYPSTGRFPTVSYDKVWSDTRSGAITDKSFALWSRMQETIVYKAAIVFQKLAYDLRRARNDHE